MCLFRHEQKEEKARKAAGSEQERMGSYYFKITLQGTRFFLRGGVFALTSFDWPTEYPF